MFLVESAKFSRNRSATTAGTHSTPEWRKGLVYLKEMVKNEEIRPEFEIFVKSKCVDIHAFEGVSPLHHSGVAPAEALSGRRVGC